MDRIKTQRGSALVYILIAIALLAALTATFMDSSSQQTSSQNTFNTVTELNSQINLIRASVQECVLTYPAGDPGIIGGTNAPYPLNPSNSYLDTPALNNEARYIRCPGNPGNSNDHAAIFAGSSGKFMPPPPNLFDQWIYYNGNDGVFFYTKTNKTDAYLQNALSKLDEQFSECEADIITSTSNLEMTSTAAVTDPKCPNGYTCFRVWIIAQPSADYPGDTGGDEAACP